MDRTVAVGPSSTGYGASVAAHDDAPTTVDADGRSVTVTHPAKVYFAEIGATKLDVIDYYLRMSGPVMRAMRDRPVLLQRFPNGASGTSFFQKRIPDSAPDWLTTTRVRTPNGTESNALVISDIAHVIWAVNLGCLGFHSWATRATDPGHCDELRIDLDPGPGTTFAMACETAHETHQLLDELGVRSYIKTTGSRGLHVYVRLEARWDSVAVRSAAVAVARELARRRPDLITDAWWKEERGRRIFVDFNQNAPHKTVFAPWSVRSRPTATVSCGFAWEELDRIDTDSLTIATVPERIEASGDPWADMDEHPQSLEPFLDMAAADRMRGLPDAPWPPEYPKMPSEPTRVAPSRAKKR